MLARRIAFLAVLFALGTAAPASAQATLDRVQVGLPGTVTKHFSQSLSLALTIPSGYSRTCCYDFVSGTWNGPAVHFAGDPGRTATSQVAWSAHFKRTKSSLARLARSAGPHGYPQASARGARVAHVLGGHTLGKLKAYTAIDQQTAPGARTEATLVIDLGRRVKAILAFALDTPDSDTSAAGAETVNGVAASAWNRRAASRVLKSVRVEGALPISRVKVRAKGRRISGSVTDVNGQAVGQAKLALQRKAGAHWKTARTGKTSLTGTFALRAKDAGRYRVVASLAGASSRSGVLRVR
jgi:Carboxypeptidase regulatory-like domain